MTVTARRVLARMAAAGLACAAILAAAVPAAAAPASGAAAAYPHLSPLPSEWWFPAWQVQSRVWPLTTGKGVTVAVIDTGVQASVPDLRGVVLPGADFTGAGTNGMIDPKGHGTGVASVIAGQGQGTGMVGIAPGAKILPIRITTTASMFRTTNVNTSLQDAEAIRYAVDHGAQVINMSFGGPSASGNSDSILSCDLTTEEAVAYALDHNVVLVAASGDLGSTVNIPTEPASCPGVLAVGAINPNGTLWGGSERQPYVAVAAPGNNIGWCGPYGRFLPDTAGTSSAAAFVSGEAALIRSRYPHMPWQQVVQRIINTALPEGRPVPNDSYGYGIVRLAGAVNAARYPVPASAPDPVYASFQHWLRSPLARSVTSPQPSASAPTVAAGVPRGTGGGGGFPFLAAVIAAAVAAALAGAAVALAAARRRRASAPSPWGPPGNR